MAIKDTLGVSFVVEVTVRDGRYEALIYCGDRDRGESLPDLELGPIVTPKGWSETLSGVVAALVDYEPAFLEQFDERRQLELGQHLYAQTFGKLRFWKPPTEGMVEVQVVTDDEHAARLPWVLLARNGLFLCASGWSVSLSRPLDEKVDCELPPSPTVLVVAPEPKGVEPTDAAAHIEELEELLSAADPHFRRGDNLLVAETWEDLVRLFEVTQPHVLYFYGHGVGDLATSQLVLAKGPARRPHYVPAADFAHFLRRAGRRLVLAYFNCCQGDAGALLGIGWQAGNAVAAVVTNRTVATIMAARGQAKEFWNSVLVRGLQPHVAVAEMYASLNELELTFRDVRWMTPILHRRYSCWTSNPPRRRSQLEHDPHWGVKLDRVSQFGTVHTQAEEMIREGKPRALAYFWYGEEGQGMEIFHQRLRVDLQQRLPRAFLYEVRPRWPDDLVNPDRSFADMLAVEALRVLSLDDVPARIRDLARREYPRIPLIYVRHQPLRQGDKLKPQAMRSYLEWWDREFAPRLVDARAYGLVGVSFIASRPTRLLEVLEKSLHDLELELRHIVFNILDEMERIAKKDLLQFLRSHNVPQPQRNLDRMLERILEKTGGRYEATLEELRGLATRSYYMDEAMPDVQSADISDDW